MITRIREIRRARGLTLEQVARRCEPSTTAQTIGRLETGMRTVSLPWMTRIAKAMDVEPSELVATSARPQLKVIAEVGASGAVSPSRDATVIPPPIKDGNVAIIITSAVGNYRCGDELWCETLQPDQFARALNRDVLVERQGGRYLFGRLIDRDQHRLQILPLDPRARQQVVPTPSWIAVAIRLVRNL